MLLSLIQKCFKSVLIFFQTAKTDHDSTIGSENLKFSSRETLKL